MSFKKIIKDYFSFSRQEKNGLAILILILVALMFAPTIYSLFYKKDASNTAERYEEQLMAFEAKLSQQAPQPKLFPFDPNTVDSSQLIELGFSPWLARTFLNYRSKGKVFYTKKDLAGVYGMRENFYKKIEPYIVIKRKKKPAKKPYKKPKPSRKKFNFNPNTVDAVGLAKLGFSQRQARTFLNYRKKGGKFYKKEDLAKIYGVSREMYEDLAPYIIIPKSTKPAKKYTTRTTSKGKLDLNLVSAYKLMELGIPSKTAWTTVNYRKSLGGYYSFEQLKNVYGITPEDIAKITENMTLSPRYIKKINLKEASYEELKRNPNIRKVADKIIQYRKQNPAIRPEDLRKILQSEEFEKIKHYIAK